LKTRPNCGCRVPTSFASKPAHHRPTASARSRSASSSALHCACGPTASWWGRCHANGPLEALRRLETLVLLADSGLPLAAVRQQLAASVDLIVHVARTSRGAERDIVAVAEVNPDGRGVRTLVDRGCVLSAPVRTR
jgi:hypothetical protein